MCTGRDAMLGALALKYQEAPIARGLAANGTVLELLSEPEGKTWTIIFTRPDGVSCVLAAGFHWQPVEKGEGT